MLTNALLAGRVATGRRDVEISYITKAWRSRVGYRGVLYSESKHSKISFSSHVGVWYSTI